MQGGLINRVLETRFPGGVTWKKCQIRRNENTETEYLKLDL